MDRPRHQSSQWPEQLPSVYLMEPTKPCPPDVVLNLEPTRAHYEDTDTPRCPYCNLAIEVVVDDTYIEEVECRRCYGVFSVETEYVCHVDIVPTTREAPWFVPTPAYYETLGQQRLLPRGTRLPQEFKGFQ